MIFPCDSATSNVILLYFVLSLFQSVICFEVRKLEVRGDALWGSSVNLQGVLIGPSQGAQIFRSTSNATVT